MARAKVLSKMTWYLTAEPSLESLSKETRSGNSAKWRKLQGGARAEMMHGEAWPLGATASRKHEGTESLLKELWGDQRFRVKTKGSRGRIKRICREQLRSIPGTTACEHSFPFLAQALRLPSLNRPCFSKSGLAGQFVQGFHSFSLIVSNVAHYLR